MTNNENMNNNVKNNDSKKITTLLILIAVLMVSTTSATYAFFALSVSNTTAVTGTAATVGLTLNVQQMDLKTNTGVMVPQLDGAPLATAMNNTNKCVDANANIVCKVYKITITNTSNSGVRLNGTIKFSGTGTSGTNKVSNLKWKRTSSGTVIGSTATGSYTTKAATNDTELDLISGGACVPGSTTQTGCTYIDLKKNGESGYTTDYYIVVWINETGSAQNDAGTWSAVVKFEGAYGRGVTSTIR